MCARRPARRPGMGGRLGALAALVTLSAVAACDGSASTGPEASPTRAESTPTDSPPPSTPTRTPTAEPGPITIAFAGDVHFENQLRTRLEDPATALTPIAPQLSAADLTVVNLETSIGTGGVREPKRFTFQAPPEALRALAHAGVDVVTMANNHAMDYGVGGLADTLAAATAAASADPSLSVVGVGADVDDAFAAAVKDVGGTRVAVAQDPAPLVEGVGQARAAADVVVVYLHWGIQGQRCPSSSQAATARALADAGADIVVGTHAHAVQGAGLLGETYVAYGLGNFVWYHQGSDASSSTGVLTLTVDGGRVVDEAWSPARIEADGLPRFATGAEAARLVDAFSSQRGCTDLMPVGRGS